MSKHTAVFVFDEELKTIVIESVDGVRQGKINSFPTKDSAVNVGFKKATEEGFDRRNVCMNNHHDIYYSGWMDCYDWVAANSFNPDEKPTVTTAHSSLVIREDQTPYDHLIGKWVKCIYCNLNQWVQVLRLSESKDCLVVSEVETEISGGYIVMEEGHPAFHVEFLEIKNPKDFKPHTIPAEVMEGLLLLPTDHPEYGNIREEVIQNAERLGPNLGWPCETTNKIAKAIDRAFVWNKDEKSGNWQRIFDLAKSGAFDPKPVLETIPFDIEKWRKGEYEKVVTRDGREVTKLTDFGTETRPLSGIIKGDDCPTSFNIDGRLATNIYGGDDTFLDLFLVINKQK